ncbi:RxLR effector protein [Phytophthora cinnamomi]|uniref:RxLR effector protein n=1 Tax=Phytophthora cinnamomi TaxID=4785 RepID=UPI00355A5D5D|nr:RxLR effector protein [Phytophthora cinnamomi]
MASSIVVGVRQRVVAFEPPLRERAALKAVKRAAAARADCGAPSAGGRVTRGSVAISDAEVFRFVSFLLTAEGSAAYPRETQQLLTQLGAIGTKKMVEMPAVDQLKTFTQWEDGAARYSLAETDRGNVRAVALVTYRPKLLLPLYMASARRAVRLVHAVVALVTANAYISTLGGGHFLCRHLSQSTLLAKLQIGISMGLKDPVLESKCRVNLMYNALQLGKFKRARRILRREELVAEQLDSSELRKVCHAATVYIDKMDRLHREQMLFQRKNGRPATLHDNFYRQRIVRMTK